MTTNPIKVDPRIVIRFFMLNRLGNARGRADPSRNWFGVGGGRLLGTVPAFSYPGILGDPQRTSAWISPRGRV